MKKRDDYLSWDEYFMGIAKLTAGRSKDPNTQVGACIVSKDNRILSTGYNGAPNNFDDDKSLTNEQDLNSSENNTIIFPNRNSLGRTNSQYFSDDKENIDSPMDEVLKDADVIDHSLTDPTKAVKEHEAERYARLCEEFGLG